VKATDIEMQGFEYLPLTKFREWLASYGLSSS
jgi:hypothetical protein